MARDLILGLALMVSAAGCSRRKPIPADGGGPAVVVVDHRPGPEEIVEVEPNNDRAHAQRIALGASVRGDISNEKDVDIYSFTPSADGGTRTQVRITLTPNPTTDPSLEVVDAAGKRVLLVSDRGPGGSEVIPNLAVTVGATYYLIVRRAFEPEERLGTTPSVSTYLLEVRPEPAPGVSELEPNGDAKTATVLSELGDVTGYFGWHRDDDWIKLPSTMGADTTLRIELGPVDGVVASVRVENGPTAVAEGRGVRGSEIRMRNVRIDGRLDTYVVLRGREGHNESNRWTLHLAIEPPVDGLEKEPNNTVGLANPLIGPTAEVSGYLWPGDADVFRVSGIPAGAVSDVEIERVEHVDLKLERLSPGGESLGHAQTGGFGEGEKLTGVRSDGDLLIRVTARSGDTVFDAPYHLQIRPGLEKK